jgi:hypothetical protein
MKGVSEVFVTLSSELLDRLRSRAADLDIPLEWLVAGLVCDTLESSAICDLHPHRLDS